MGRTGRRTARAAGLIAVLAAVAALAACGGSKSSAEARASAAATSTVAQSAKADAKALFAHCFPVSTVTQLQLLEPTKGKPAREQVMACMGVPAADRQAAAACTLGRVEHGGKLPPGKQAKEEALLNDAYPCVQQYQAGGTPSPSGSANTPSRAVPTASASAK